jgi:hypothetical protein
MTQTNRRLAFVTKHFAPPPVMVKKSSDHRVVEFSLVVKRILRHRGGLSGGMV